MSGIFMDNNPATPYALQMLARHEMITALYQDILTDMAVCEIEGWDKSEYIRMIQESVNFAQKV